MAGTQSTICFFAAAFCFGVAATVKLLTWILIRNSEYAGGEGCLGNLIFSFVAVAGMYLMYLSIFSF